MKRLALSVALIAGILATKPASATIIDTNFTETTFVNTGVANITGMGWAPDGSQRLFLSVKGGPVRIIENGVLLPTPFATISPVFTNSECGVIGLAFDPNFINNRYVYFFVTVSNSEQQIIRYTANGNVGGSKTTIVPNLPTAGNNHDGGGIAFGPDGKLYWGIGDNGNGTGVDANLTSLAAKIGRANPDGSVPSDNPYVDGTGPNNDLIWARGFRNPFTMTFQQSTGLLWVNSVGTAYEQVFVTRRGDHAGYNDYENNQPTGFITPAIVYRTNGSDTRTITAASRNGGVATFTTSANHGFRLGGRIDIAGVSDTSFNGFGYVTAVPTQTQFSIAQTGGNASGTGGSATTLNIGGAITGGTFWESTAIPAAYRGNYFFGDYNSGRIERATLNGSNVVTSVDHWANNLGAPIDIDVGPDGNLYYVNIAGLVRRAAPVRPVTDGGVDGAAGSGGGDAAGGSAGSGGAGGGVDAAGGTAGTADAAGGSAGSGGGTSDAAGGSAGSATGGSAGSATTGGTGPSGANGSGGTADASPSGGVAGAGATGGRATGGRAGATPAAEDDGCGCRAAGGSQGMSRVAALALLLVIAGRRLRRDSRNRRAPKSRG